jgi:tetratricopeptide (TPR) repeat protein
MAKKQFSAEQGKKKSGKALKGPAWLYRQSWHLGLLVALSFLLYANTLTHEYTQDDAIVITENMFTKDGFSGIPGILSYDTFYGFFQVEGKAKLVSGGRYRPLTLILFAVEYELFGPNPFVGHLMNVVFFALTVIVLYWLLLYAFNHLKAERQTMAYTVALSAGLIFAAHPIHTEVVANIKGRDEIIALLGALSALYLSLKAYRLNKGWVWHVLAGLLFFIGLMSKENAITFLAVVPLSFYFFTRASFRKLLLHSVPFVLAAVLFLIIRTSILGLDFGEPSSELMNNPFLKFSNGQYIPLAFQERLATVLFTLGKYVQLLFFPHPLTHDYYPRHIDIMSFADWQVLLSLFVYLGMGIYALWGIKKKDPVSFGILYYLATLSIISNLFFPVGTNMAERLAFMPSVGFCLIIGILMGRLARRKKGTLAVWPLYLVVVLAVLLGIKTVSRNTVWKDNYTLFTTDVKTSKNSAKLRNAAGGELVFQSTKTQDEVQKQQMLLEAEGHLKEAVRIHPFYKEAYLILGNCYNYLKRYDESVQAYTKALQIDPSYEEANNNLAITYQQGGRFYGEQQGNLQKAIQYLEQAGRMRPKDFETNRLLGVAYGLLGNPSKAIEFFTKATEIESNNADAWFMLGTAYYNAGQADVGQQYHQKAISIDPEVTTRMGGGNN